MNGIKIMQRRFNVKIISQKNSKKFVNILKKDWQKHLLLFPPTIIIIIFCYIPMVGIVIAFQDYYPTFGYFGSPWVGMDNFIALFSLPNFINIIWNTLFIAILKIVSVLITSIIFALMLNEMQSKKLKSIIQSFVLFPFFISWVILAGIVKDVFMLDGVINKVIVLLGFKEIPFLTDSNWFVFLLILSNLWKDYGYNAIIITAALTSIDPMLYEAATIDGANRWKKINHITLPGIRQIVLMLTILAMGGILNAGFDQVYNLYNILVENSSEIIDTYVFKIGIRSWQYGLGTAAGLFKSIVGCILLISSYIMADKFAQYKIF